MSKVISQVFRITIYQDKGIAHACGHFMIAQSFKLVQCSQNFKQIQKLIEINKFIALGRWHYKRLASKLITYKNKCQIFQNKVPLFTKSSVKVIDFDRINLVCNIEASNQSCKENHLLFQCELNVLSLRTLLDQSYCFPHIQISCQITYNIFVYLAETMLFSFILYKGNWQTFFFQ